MKVLAVSPRQLWPIETGLELRVYNLLKPLGTRHEIDLICFAPAEDKLTESEQVLGQTFRKVIQIPFEFKQPHRLGFFKTIWSYFFNPKVFLRYYSSSPEMQQTIDTALESENYDLVYVNTGFLLPYFLKTKKIPMVLDAIDDPSCLFYSQYKASRGLAKKVSTFLDWMIFRRYEQKYFPAYKEIILASSKDAVETQIICPKSTVTAVANGVDADFYVTHEKRSDTPTVLFTGVMDYDPNIMAALYFSRQILPLLLKKKPDLKFIIVGRRPSPEIENLAKESGNIEVTGEVPDMRPYLGQAHVYACPLISGAGIKNKILEAWSAGLPIVATSLSCEGIEVNPDEDILVADKPEEFAERILDIINNGELADRLARLGREKIERLYDWKSKADTLEIIWKRSVEKIK